MDFVMVIKFFFKWF